MQRAMSFFKERLSFRAIEEKAKPLKRSAVVMSLASNSPRLDALDSPATSVAWQQSNRNFDELA